MRRDGLRNPEYEISGKSPEKTGGKHSTEQCLKEGGMKRLSSSLFRYSWMVCGFTVILSGQDFLSVCISSYISGYSFFKQSGQIP